jgi:hypothetical protein
VLVGERRGDIWLCRPLNHATGKPATVEFDGAAALAREEAAQDVVGFLHTHPDCEAKPSQRDRDTMQAWTSALGKPLLCLIEGTDGLRGFCFPNDESPGEPIEQVERFEDGIIIAVRRNSNL